MSDDFKLFITRLIKIIGIIFVIFYIIRYILFPIGGLAFTIGLGSIDNLLSIYHLVLYAFIASLIVTVFLFGKTLKHIGSFSQFSKWLVILIIFFGLHYISIMGFSKYQRDSYNNKEMERWKNIEQTCTKIDRPGYYYYKCGKEKHIPDEFLRLYTQDDSDIYRYDAEGELPPEQKLINITSVTHNNDKLKNNTFPKGLAITVYAENLSKDESENMAWIGDRRVSTFGLSKNSLGRPYSILVQIPQDIEVGQYDLYMSKDLGLSNKIKINIVDN